MFEAGNARKTEEALLVQRDWRADGGARRVRVTPGKIVIMRRFGGMEMTIAVPVSAYRGVVLDVREGADGAPLYRLSLDHRDRDLEVVLGRTQDSAEALADWKFWASWFGLPRLTVTDGQLVRAGAGEAAAPRRGNAAVRQRRPQFLARRKTGDGRRMADVFAGEREIVCYE